MAIPIITNWSNITLKNSSSYKPADPPKIENKAIPNPATGGQAPGTFLTSGSSATPQQVTTATKQLDAATTQANVVMAKGAVATAAITTAAAAGIAAAPIIASSPISASTAAAVTSKTIIKGGLPLVAGAGILGYLLGGGGKQEQTQTASQPTNVIPDQITPQDQKGAIDTTLTGKTETVSDISQRTAAATTSSNEYGGSVFDLQNFNDFLYIPTTTTNTTTQAIPSVDFFSGLLNQTPQYLTQEAAPIQLTVTTPTQEQGQQATQAGNDWLIIGIAALAALMFFRGKK